MMRSAAKASDLGWQPAPGFRFAPLNVPTNGRAGFTLLAPTQTGIVFSNILSPATVAKNRLTEIGSGVALGDVDGDGWVDIYFCGMEGGNVLYRNLGNWKFEDITAQSGVACTNQYSTGCVFADIDGDGDLDLLVNSLGGGTRVFLNDGKAHFTELMASGLIRRLGATSMALGDVTGDGTLALYVANYRTDTFFDNPPGVRMQSRQLPDGSVIVEPTNRFLGIITPRGGITVVEKGEPDFFYLGHGDGRFKLQWPWESGRFLDEDAKPLAGAPTDWGLSVMLRDLNGDGLPDLYICNDFVNWPDRIWLNRDSRHFQAPQRTALRCVSLSSMSMDVADINRDGYDDIFVADMLSPRREQRAWQRPDTLSGDVIWPLGDPDFRPEVTRNTLHLSRGDGTYAEIAQLAGLAATDWTWGAVFLDVDLDGWEDLLVATGSNRDVQDADAMRQIIKSAGFKTTESRLTNYERIPRRAAPGVAFRNRHNLTFEDVSADWGFNTVGVGQGMALADLDNDGDLDVVINCLNEPARIYRNNSPAPRIAVRLKGAGHNTRGINAKIKVTGGPVTQTQEMISGGRYLSGDDPMRVFAAGQASQMDVEIKWRSGKQSVVKGARPNCIYEIDETGAASQAIAAAANRLTPLFEDVSQRINHLHSALPFDDFARQPLLPRKLSTEGLAVGWADVDGDGFDDLIVSGGKGGHLRIFRGDGAGGFAEWGGLNVPQSNLRDQISVVLASGPDGVPRLAVGESNWEDADTNASSFNLYSLASGPSTPIAQLLRNGRSSTGPLAVADVDGDGELDLFVGGRATAGRYPEAATSLLLRGDHGVFRMAQTFTNLGRITGAAFVDIDNDGAPDLVLASEWDSIRLFHNDHGKLVEVTRMFGLDRFKALWNGIAIGDFDGDGRLDLAASNWGRNWRTDQTNGVDAPVYLYYGDFNGDGVVQTLVASEEPWLHKITPWRERKALVAAMPWISDRFPTHHLYGRAGISELLGDRAAMARELRCDTFDAMVFLNRGDYFEARPLPIEAQFAPSFSISVADFDGDGAIDLFLTQNFFGVDAETSRQDAGTGLVLLGDGHGGFRALAPSEAGFSIYGEQRGSAVADFDGDGRIDLAVGQYNGATRLLHNKAARAGVRVSLRGPAGNPRGIGASVRLKFGDQFGPAQAVAAGNGRGSQDSTTLIFGTPTRPTGVRVQWPGGRVQEWPWPENLSSVEISTNGPVAPANH